MRKYLKIFNKHLWQRTIGLVLIALLTACSPVRNGGSGEVLVRVYDEYLYVSDLDGVIPSGLSVRDSLTMVRTFIQNWVDKQLIVKKAEENLPDELKDFAGRLEDYRNSLIIYEYEKMLLQQDLDTVVSTEAVANYYEQYKKNFKLNEDMMMMNYLVLHNDSPHIQKFRQTLRSEEPADFDTLALYCSKYATDFNLMKDKWFNRDELMSLIPMQDYSFMDFQTNRRFFEIDDSVFTFMVRFLNYKPVDSIAPVQAVEKEIKEIILNSRKKSLIENMRHTVLQDAVENNQVEIY